MGSGRRGVVRLILPSPDGTRVLARPNGLAGWTLPTMAVDLPFDAWDEDAIDRAGRAIGAVVVPEASVAAGTWVVSAGGRVPTVGRTWVDVADAGRLGADADVVREWAAGDVGAGGPTHGDGSPG